MNINMHIGIGTHLEKSFFSNTYIMGKDLHLAFNVGFVSLLWMENLCKCNCVSCL